MIAIGALESHEQAHGTATGAHADCDQVQALYPLLLDALAQGGYEDSLLEQFGEALGPGAAGADYLAFENALNDFEFERAREHLVRAVEAQCPKDRTGDEDA